MDNLITIEEAATLIGVSSTQVRRLVNAGILPVRRYGDRIRLIDEEAAKRYAASPRRAGWPKGKPRPPR